MTKIYIIGVFILLIAIIANAIIAKFEVMSWYDFIETLQIDGTDTFKKMELFDYLWLIIIYPFILGLGYYFGEKLYQLF